MKLGNSNAECNKPVTQGQTLCTPTCMRNRESNPSRQKADGGGWGLGAMRKDGELLFKGDKSQFGKMGSVLKMDGGEGCKTVWTSLVNYIHSKVIKSINFMLCIFKHQ